MRNFYILILFFMFGLPLFLSDVGLLCMADVIKSANDDYIDDLYYTPSDAKREANELKPRYKNGIKEIIFIEEEIEVEDTIQSGTLDTIQPIIQKQ